ncbi:MAG: L-glyceraldehyde 3-phosphate reductase [Proteobacteria bacterium]|nr:L-glyceraldehyde 3-phosphate reductase [Pseudomonadota bacterium]MBS0573598.1 L-glyceraldehyde 3-phosphate reductase [Pseudomonadota bacterium]
MYVPAPSRYGAMTYRRVGRSGLRLPALSLGLWHNFGGDAVHENARAMCRTAFDLGITHFDLANNYGPPPGSAEEAFGRILRTDFGGLRDELVISSKAGYRMWDGPYGEWGSRKYLIASCDQSLKRTGLEYFDIFYSHRFDPDTPLEETMGALDAIVRAGKALYVGISSYTSEQTARAAAILRDLGTPCLIHQPRYSILGRWTERDGLLDRLETEGMGCISFSPLAQGMLSAKYLNGIPAGSRAASGKLAASILNDEAIRRLRGLNEVAAARGQSLAQMAVAYVLRDPRMTSALVGASRPEQIRDSVGALANTAFSAGELAQIEELAFESEDW